jgi:hypothetical protein
VASSIQSRNDAGYATPTALVFTLALALVAAVLVQRSVSQLRLARTDLVRAQLEYALDGAQLSAAATVVRSGAGGPYRWPFSTDVGWVEAVAESESDKVGVAAAAQLDANVYRALGVEDVDALKGRLAAVGGGALLDVGSLDTAPLWRTCAASLVSTFGTKTSITAPSVQQPHMGDLTPAWRVGEVWRLQVTTSTGWRDERIVRFTGDERHPAAVVLRQMSRGQGGQGQCDAVFAAMA